MEGIQTTEFTFNKNMLSFVSSISSICPFQSLVVCLLRTPSGGAPMSISGRSSQLCSASLPLNPSATEWMAHWLITAEWNSNWLVGALNSRHFVCCCCCFLRRYRRGVVIISAQISICNCLDTPVLCTCHWSSSQCSKYSNVINDHITIRDQYSDWTVLLSFI